MRVNLARNYIWGTSARVDDGAWHHVAVTWSNASEEGAALRIFVDGLQVAQVPLFAEGDVVNSGTFVMGQDQDELDGGYADYQRLIGALDVVAIFDEALPAERIYAHATWLLCGALDDEGGAPPASSPRAR